MPRILFKTPQFFQNLRLEFPKHSMEKEYQSLQEENMAKDFKACLEFLIILNIVITFISALNKSWVDVYFAGAPVIILIPIYWMRVYLHKYLQFIVLIIILSYNLSRLFLIQPFFHEANQGRLFYSGFSMATLQSVLFVRLLKVSQKFLAIVGMFILRFVIVSAYIDPGSFAPISFVRHFLIDSYMIYTLYTQEVNFRKIYQKFVSKNEELLKFKELLAESLPQSLVVVSYTTNSLLFSNKAFQNTSNELANFESLYVDPSSIRSISNNFDNLDFLDGSKHPLSLAGFLKKLTSKDCINDKTVSLSAYTIQNTNRKLFQVTLKKVDWDSKDSIAIIFNDITYQENIIALKLANINKDKIIATVSHELRTPLNGIMGILEATEKQVKNPKVAEHLSLCKDNAQLLLSLVNSILDLQQISAGKLKLNPENIDIRNLIYGIARLFYFQCKEKAISLVCDIHTNVPNYIFTDQNRLKQILINLVGNAIKFTSKGSIKIEVNIPKDTEKLQVSVIDSGIGIKKEDQKKLFKMYSKIEDGESVNKNGVGLGLTISNALSLILNGTTEGQGIKVDSEYGVGSRFYFEIQKDLKERKQLELENEKSPRHKSNRNRTDRQDTAYALLTRKVTMLEEKTEEDYLNIEDNIPSDCNEFFTPTNLELKLLNYTIPKRMGILNLFTQGTDDFQLKEVWTPRKNSPEAFSQSSVLTGEKLNFDVLIVDDNPFNLLVAKNLLQEFECKIKTALGGREAIDIVKKSVSEGIRFQVIFMDCQMPIMDGFETTKILRAMMMNKEIEEVQIYAWTANNSEEDVKRCFEVGMRGHLPKPATKADFCKVLSKL